MKILLVSSISPLGMSGSSRVLHDMADYLCARGHHVDVLTYTSAQGNARLGGDAPRYSVHEVTPQGLPGTSSLVMFYRLVALSLRHRYDLVLCGVAYPSAILAYLARAMTRCPYAIFSHGEDVTMVKGSRLKTLLLARVLSNACIIMANSNSTRREAISISPTIDRERVAIVPLWLDPTRFERIPQAAVDALRAHLDLIGKRVILTVGRLEERKGQDTVIRALRTVRESIPDVCYVIAGMGDQARLRALTKSMMVEDIVTFVDHLSDAGLPALYHLCEVFVMVSRWDPVTHYVEGFGLVYLEAAACGKPSIAGSMGGSADAVEDGETGLIVDPNSADETAHAITSLLSDPVRAAVMGEAGRRRVYEYFGKERRLAYMAQLLESAGSTTSNACNDRR